MWFGVPPIPGAQHRQPGHAIVIQMSVLLRQLADSMMLGSLLERLRDKFGGYELVDHWQQGEFHHDVVLRVSARGLLPGDFIVVATNCNGGVKEVLSFASLPDRMGLWQMRCPSNPEFVGETPTVLGRELTVHWFDPCELLLADARSELREEFRERQCGGGWQRRQ
jgi:hypothetical protein